MVIYNHILYHANCPDGIASAYAFWHRYAKYRDKLHFYPMIHGNDPPNLTNKNIAIVDFSFDKNTIINLCTKNKRVIILDHHASVYGPRHGPSLGTDTSVLA